MNRRITSIILLLILMGGLVKHAFVDFDAEKSDSTIAQKIIQKEEVPDNTLILWYTDSSLEEYIADVALAYKQETGMEVVAELVDGIDYLESINFASVNESSTKPAPDLYITTHDNLMKAYLAGLAVPIIDSEEKVCENNFPETALHAISCDGKYVAYPLYYETNFFLYNKTYMASIAQGRMEAENDKAEGEIAQAEADENKEALKEEAADTVETETDIQEEAVIEEEPYGDEEVVADPEVLERLATMIPSTIDDITTFANNYEAPDTVEAVFKWDVTDIFYNYFFVGNYLEVG